MKISHSDGSATYLGVVNVREGSTGEAPLIHSRRYGFMFDAGVTNNGIAVGYDDRLLVKPPGDSVTSVNYTVGSDPELTIKPAD